MSYYFALDHTTRERDDGRLVAMKAAAGSVSGLLILFLLRVLCHRCSAARNDVRDTKLYDSSRGAKAGKFGKFGNSAKAKKPKDAKSRGKHTLLRTTDDEDEDEDGDDIIGDDGDFDLPLRRRRSGRDSGQGDHTAADLEDARGRIHTPQGGAPPLLQVQELGDNDGIYYVDLQPRTVSMLSSFEPRLEEGCDNAHEVWP